MKKFNVSENLMMAMSQSFKNKIRSAVENTDNERQSTRERWDIKFVGTVVTFNPTSKKVQYFDLRSYADVNDKKEVAETLAETLYRIERQDEYAQNEFITFIEAIDFTYYGYTGYVNENERKVQAMEIENKFMALYIDILSKVNEDNRTIEEMNFSVRTTNCLKRANINTVQQIKELSMDDVMRIRNLGRRSYDELEEVLNIKFS